MTTARPARRSCRTPLLGPLAVVVMALAQGGCVQRVLVIESDPPGALVYLNDQEVGRTPMTREFTWYGTYDLALRAEGYETLKARTPVIAPWWQWFPIDFLAELVPFRLTDRQQFKYALKPTDESRVDPQRLMARGDDLRGKLIGSEVVPEPTTKPAKPRATRPATRPSTRPTSRPDTDPAT